MKHLFRTPLCSTSIAAALIALFSIAAPECRAGQMTSMSTVSLTGSVSRTQSGTSTFMTDTPTFDQFDPSVGNLTAATLEFDIDGTASLTTSVFAVGYVQFNYNGQNQKINFDTDNTRNLTFTGPDGTANLDLTAVTGLGTFDLGQFSAQYNMSQGTFPSGADTTATLKFTLTYTYDAVTPPPPPAVPEPSTFALLGIGGLALVGFGKRRKQ